eukprot:gene5878-7315_t
MTTTKKTTEASEFIAKVIKDNEKIVHIFGIVGVPITPIAEELQKMGMPFYGFRNEQAASYGASVVGYLTGLPALCLTVSGPGMVHALAGVLNAQSNCWPLVLMSSSISNDEVGKGAFQESKQIEVVQHYCKKSYQIDQLERFPYILNEAVQISMEGRPGPVYIQLPTNVIKEKINKPIGELETKSVDAKQPNKKKNIENERLLDEAYEILKSAKHPLVVGGKGASYARVENEVREFVERTGLPFLTSPMGKGLLNDDHPQAVSAARSVALKQADVVLMLGARLNWMFNFGEAPTFSPDVRFIVVDIEPSSIPHSFSNGKKQQHISIIGDLVDVMQHLVSKAACEKIHFPIQEWMESLKVKSAENTLKLETLMNQPQAPGSYLTYHQVFKVLADHLITRDSIFVNEGANTMDIGRVCIPQYTPRSRLDAGTLSTMGIGVGYAIAASIVSNRRQPVVCVLGDSAFGFSGMELETAARYQLPIVFVIVNNNGVYEGLEEMPFDQSGLSLPPTSLLVDARYEKMAEAFGGKGYFIDNQADLESICREITSTPIESRPQNITVLNVKIKPSSIKPKIVH